MKQWHWTIVMVAVCAALGVYCFTQERGKVPEGPLAFKFADKDLEQIERIELVPAKDEDDTATKDSGDSDTEEADQAEAAKPAVVLTKSGDTWKIEKPFEARADQEKVKQLLDRVKDLVITDRLMDDADPDDLEMFGLKKPKASVTVVSKGKGPTTLLFGKKNPESTKVYTMKKGQPSVFLIRTALYDDANKEVDDFRDKDALSFEKNFVTKVRLTRKESTLEIEKKDMRPKEEEGDDDDNKDEDKVPEFDYTWWLSKPVEARAEKYDCDNIVTKLDDLKIDKWIDNEPTAEQLAEYSLDKPWLTADVWIAEEKRPRKLLIGKKAEDETDKHYAKNSLDKAVFLVAKSILDDLKKEAKDLRDKDVFDFEKDEVEKFAVTGDKLDVMCRKTARGDEEEWRLLKPQEVKADKKKVDDILWDLDGVRANEFIDDPKDDKEYGLDEPKYTVKLWLKGKSTENTLLVGNRISEKDDADVYVKVEGEKTVYQVGKSVLEDVEEIDPKQLRDRTVIKFTRDDLKKLEIKFGKKHVVLDKVADDWKMVKPKAMDADNSDISSILWKFEDFHADEYVGPAPKDLKKYGFDKPQAEITFHVRGKKPQTVILGDTKDEKIYVMLKGGKSVFRHKESLLDDVRKDEDDLKKSPPSSPSP